MCLPAASSANLQDTSTEKKVAAEMVFEHGSVGPSACTAVVFVQWRDDPGKELRATAFYTTTRGEESTSRESPFEDEYYHFRPPPGQHRIVVGESSKAALDGTTPQDCSDLDARHREIFGPNASVEVTIERTEACIRAQKRLKKIRARIAAARRDVASARTQVQRARAKKRLNRAKREREAVREEIKEECGS